MFLHQIFDWKFLKIFCTNFGAEKKAEKSQSRLVNLLKSMIFFYFHFCNRCGFGNAKKISFEFFFDSHFGTLLKF